MGVASQVRMLGNEVNVGDRIVEAAGSVWMPWCAAVGLGLLTELGLESTDKTRGLPS